MKNAESIISNHLSSFQNNDLEAVMSDYTNESVLITQDAVYKGLKEIASFFANLIPHFPKQATSFELNKMIVNDGFAFIVWNATTPSVDLPLGSDTFIIKDGKISKQLLVVN